MLCCQMKVFWVILCLCVAAIGGQKTVFGRNKQHLRTQNNYRNSRDATDLVIWSKNGYWEQYDNNIGNNMKEIQGKVGS